jgi:hypothetical protein
MDWLFGAVANAGIVLPKKFDLPGIFSLVMQVLGLTYKNIRARLVAGIANVYGEEKAEKAVSMIEKGFDFIRRIITEGPSAIWEWIKESLADLKEKVIDGILTWVRNTIVMKAIMKLVSMLNPVGALVQAAIAIYDVIVFFIDNWQRIQAVVSAIFSAIANVAMGQLTQAAGFIEKTMAKGMTMLLAFLARLIGLGGISQKVREVIKKIQKPINAAIEKFVTFVVKKAKPIMAKITGGVRKLKEKGKAAVGKLIQWWKMKKKFKTTGGEAHTLFFEGKESSANLVIASKKVDYVKFIKNIKTDSPEKANALKVAQEIVTEQKKNAKTELEKQKRAENIRLKINQLAKFTAVIAAGTTEAPPSVVKYGPMTGEGGATKMEAPILSKNNITGSAPSDNAPIWQKANRRRPSSSFIQGHLLNNRLGGPGKRYNLTPITGNQSPSRGGNFANADHERDVESHVKTLVLKLRKVVSYTVKVDYGGHGKRPRKGLTGNKKKKEEIMAYEEKYLPTKLHCKWQVLKNVKGLWAPDNQYKAPAGVEANGEKPVKNKLPEGDFDFQA